MQDNIANIKFHRRRTNVASHLVKGLMLCYNVHDEESFRNVEKWILLIKQVQTDNDDTQKKSLSTAFINLFFSFQQPHPWSRATHSTHHRHMQYANRNFSQVLLGITDQIDYIGPRVRMCTMELKIICVHYRNLNSCACVYAYIIEIWFRVPVCFCVHDRNLISCARVYAYIIRNLISCARVSAYIIEILNSCVRVYRSSNYLYE